MRVKFPSEDLNPSPYLPHLTSIYTCRVTTAPTVRDSWIILSDIYVDKLSKRMKKTNFLDFSSLSIY